MRKVFSYVAIRCSDFTRAFESCSAVTGGLIRKHPGVPFPMAYFVDEVEEN